MDGWMRLLLFNNSGLAVQPNNNLDQAPRDSLFANAENATAEDEESSEDRRTITMVR
jgi:hypothetical protein